ncbi:MAG: ATP-binding protein [Vicinamibacterales bacterium]
MAPALAGTIDRPVFAGFRGPLPPFRVCPECDSVSDEPWENPILAGLKKAGLYTGETTGGYCLCPSPCEQLVEERHKARAAAPRQVLDAPIAFAKARLDDVAVLPENKHVFTAAKKFLADGATHDLYLCGPVGVGKTLFACAIGHAFAQRMPSVRFVRTHTLLLKLQEGMASEGESAALSDYAEPAILILDDVGVEKGSDYSRRTLQTLYDMRLDRGRRTIWTSNLDLEQLNAFLDDDRLTSRIAGAADVVWLDGEDRRLRPVRQARDGAREDNQWDR